MTQHHQDQHEPAAGNTADGRIKKPRHKKFQTQSYGERMAAEAAPASPAAGEVRDDTARGERRGGPTQYSDRGVRSYDRAPVKGYRAERANQPRREDDRPQYRRDDRPSFKRDDRPSYQQRDERPSYKRDERPSYKRDDRTPYQQRDDRPSFKRDERPSYQQRDERPRFERNDRVERPTYRRDDKQYTKRDEAPVDLGTVAPDNQFAQLGLAPRLIQRLARDGITTPFPIQAATIPDALAGKDVLGRGQTGSGKTLGFGLPTLTRLAGGRTESRRPRGMILVPTRELAMQVHDALEPLAHVMNVSLKLIAGGLPYPKQIDALRRGVDLLIATPGRLIDLCEQGAADLGAVEIAVLDEADHMCDMGFMPAVTTLLDMTPADGQRLLFSATLDNDVDKIVKTYLKDPVQHSTESGQATVTTMEHHLLVIEPGHKQSLTAELASRDGRTIVFVRTKLGADRVATQLRDRGVMAAALHGGLTQGARNRTLDQFKDGSVPVLVATDVAARGIHVDDVGLIVQADPAADHKDYLHRAGRTARAGGKGAVVTLVLPHQRRGMVRLAESAGVDAEPVRARPGDQLVTELTGGNKPSGYPVKLPAPKPQRFGKGGGKGGKRFGSSRPGRGHDSRGGSGPRRSNGPRRTDGKSYQH
ncbi:DEAD/DEAH box helicase [Kribbella sp. NPDC049227]|uniref:DEAD/DEAH box helicase n=1 Tax=Kribbella sp. NPDC049227 TaxID=3364113 RepID=UPI0037203A2B